MKYLAVPLSALVLLSTASAQRGGPQAGQRMNVEDLPPILQKMFKSVNSLKYSGVVRVERREGSSREISRQYVLRDGSKSRLWYPKTGKHAGEVIVENEKESRRYFPGRNMILVTPPMREGTKDRLFGLFRRGSKFDVQPGDAIAGVPTTRVAITDARGRNTQRLWLDKEKGVVLKREFLDGVGSAEYTMVFEEIDYSPKIKNDDFLLNVKGARIVTMATYAQEYAKEKGYLSVIIPQSEKDYRILNVRVLDMGSKSVLHQSYQGKSGMVSLFQAKGSSELTGLGGFGKERPPMMNVHVWTFGGNTFALFGSPSEEELKRLATVLSKR